MLKYFTALLLFLVIPFQAVSAPVLLTPYTPAQDVVPHLEYNVSEGTVLDPPPVEGWAEFTQTQIKLGFDQSIQWFRFELRNELSHPMAYDLVLGNPLIDEIVVYILSDGKVLSVQNLGDSQPFHLRPVKHESFVVPISFQANETLEVYIALQTSGTVKLPITVWQKEAFQEVQSSQKLNAGIYSGIMLSALFVFLALYAFTRELSALYTAGFVFSLMMICFTLAGFSFHYFWPNYPALQQHAIYIFTCTAIIFSALHATQSLSHLLQSEPLSKLFYLIAAIAAAIIPITLYLSFQTGIYLITGIAMIICFSHIYIGWINWREGMHEHQEFNVGLLGLLIALILISLDNFMFVDLTISNLQLLQLSSIAFVLVLVISTLRAYGGGYQVYDDIDEVEESDKDLQLSEQMMELQFAMRELQEKNEQLAKLNTIDDLSGIYNRRHFDKRVLAELRRARRELTPLSLIIFDIDHFKNINDNYGHVIGDEVIRSVAFHASHVLNRPSDEIFRYGGEEFTVLLPNTDLAGASVLAENIRKTIEALEISSHGETLSCTISLGVACHMSEQAITPELFISQADTALYQAKQSGRNIVKQHQADPHL
ncbi:MAG: diguanylate cyclase [Gammaproteobacteria bacterium]|nr:diguanylate cyclase [Gammaproteobacteria bacterium]